MGTISILKGPNLEMRDPSIRTESWEDPLQTLDSEGAKFVLEEP